MEANAMQKAFVTDGRESHSCKILANISGGEKTDNLEGVNAYWKIILRWNEKKSVLR